jgi:hypothetical protein
MKISKYQSLFMLLVILIANQSLAQITTDYDKTVDFTKFKSYTFKGWSKDSDQKINQLDQDRILAAFEHEFESRGLIKDDDNPDMSVTLFVVVQDKTSTTAYSNYYGGMGYGRSFGYGYANTNYSTQEYQQGTVIIDFYDEGEKSLIWEGVLKSVVKEKAKKREKSIPENIRKLMYKYPIKPIKKKK